MHTIITVGFFFILLLLRNRWVKNLALIYEKNAILRKKGLFKKM